MPQSTTNAAIFMDCVILINILSTVSTRIKWLFIQLFKIMQLAEIVNGSNLEKTLNSSCTILSTSCLVSVNISSKIFYEKFQWLHCINYFHNQNPALYLDRIFINIAQSAQSINVAAFVVWGAGYEYCDQMVFGANTKRLFIFFD